MLRQLLLILLLVCWAVPALAHGTGRWCSNSGCMMCNRAHLQAGHGKRVRGLTYSRYRQLHNSLHQASAKRKLEPKPDVDECLAPVPDFVPTPQAIVDAALAILHPSPSDVLCDLGCGDGRVVIAAAKTYGCRAIGVEHNKHNAALAERNVKAAGVGDLVTIIEQDVREFDLENVTVVWMYLEADLIKELKPKFSAVRCVVSYQHPLPGVPNQEVVIGETGPVYFWIRR